MLYIIQLLYTTENNKIQHEPQLKVLGIRLQMTYSFITHTACMVHTRRDLTFPACMQKRHVIHGSKQVFQIKLFPKKSTPRLNMCVARNKVMYDLQEKEQKLA